MFDPDSISASKLNDLRAAAEKAWGDDTRHERFIGHPNPCAGQCFVTSQWMTKHLGGHVGQKDGHFFWTSPDKHYAIDLTGDRFAYPPVHSDHEFDQDEEGVHPVDPEHKTWRAGPIIYKRTDHPLFSGFRVIDDHSDHPRAQQFARKADLALSGKRVSSVKVADLMGPSGLQTPQQQEDSDLASLPMPMLHDEPGYDPVTNPQREYKWVFANGQLHVSPVHEHAEMFDHAGANPESDGPAAVGYVTVYQNRATWEVESNVSLRGLHQVLQDYCDTVGWEFDGMVGTNGGPLHEDFGPKKSMWYAFRKDGHLLMSERPLPKAKRVTVLGKTAYVTKRNAALEEWAQDFGYKLAEFPGGGDMTDKMKTRENLDVFNRGDTDWQPEAVNPDFKPEGTLNCGICGKSFDDFEQLRLHERAHEPLDKEEIQDGHFPQLRDFDEPLGFGTHPQGTGWNSDSGFSTASVDRPETGGKGQNQVHRRGTRPSHRWTAVHILPDRQEIASRHPRFDLYAGLFGYDTEAGHRFYGAYRDGQLVGYGAVRLNSENLASTQKHEPEVLMIDATISGQGVGSAILSLMQRHFDSFYTHADSEAGERLMRRLGMVNVEGHRWRWAKGKMPKDLIEAPIPLIYDFQTNHIHIGYPGQKTHDIEGKFTPGGVVEGYYDPGGKVTLIPASNLPYTTYGFGSAWYSQFPQMEITKLEEEGRDGKVKKIAAEDVGNYIRRILPTDQAAYRAYHALKDAGGKVYAVGGVVRDALQGREPNDIDLMVGGLPASEVEAALHQIGRVDFTGKNFGVYRVKTGSHEVEVALPRQDKYETSQRGKGVVTVDHNLPVEQDLERRDFTANSMAVDLDSGKLIDPYKGAHDSQNYILRTTHPDSFREDPTRLVRALAMHGRFGLNPDPKTRSEMAAHGHLLRGESPDAINQILTKSVFGPKNGNPAGSLQLAHDTGIMPHLFPQAAQHWEYDQNNPHHNYKLGEHHLHVLDNTSRLTSDPDVRMAAWLHDWGKPASMSINPQTGYARYYEAIDPVTQQVTGADHARVGAGMAEDWMRGMNYPVARIKRVSDLVRHHMFGAFNSSKGARKFLQRVGDHADDLLKLREADMAGKGVTPEEQAAQQSVQRMRQLVDESRKEQAPTDLQNLAINGNDLTSLGLPPGPQTGQILRQLLNDVVEQPTLNERNQLLQRAQGYINAIPS